MPLKVAWPGDAFNNINGRQCMHLNGVDSVACCSRGQYRKQVPDELRHGSLEQREQRVEGSS
jgi:hypothetical protein